MMYIPQLFLLLFSPHTLDIAIIPTHNPQVCLIFFAFAQINQVSSFTLYQVKHRVSSELMSLTCIYFSLICTAAKVLGIQKLLQYVGLVQERLKFRNVFQRIVGAANPKQCYNMIKISK